MHQLIDQFIAWKTAGHLAPSTLRQRRLILLAFNTYRPLDQATPGDITAYINAAGRGPSRAKSVRSSLATFYAWAIAAGHLTRDPTVLVHSIREPMTLPRPTPRAAILAGLAHADEPTRAAIMLGYRAGLRLSEITQLHTSNLTDLGLHITGKGGRARLVPIHADLRPYLGFHAWRFPSPRWSDRHAHPDHVADRITAATGHRSHGLRHRFATDIYEATRDLRSLQILLGHSSIQTTQRYVFVADSRLAAVVNSLH